MNFFVDGFVFYISITFKHQKIIWNLYDKILKSTFISHSLLTVHGTVESIYNNLQGI